MIGRSELKCPDYNSYRVSKSVLEDKKKRVLFEPYKSLDFPVHVPLESLAAEGKITLCGKQSRVNVGTATCGRAAGSLGVYNNLEKRDWNEKASVYKVGCLGACYAEPLVNIRTPDGKHYFYGNIDTNSFWRIIKTAEEPPGGKTSPYLWAIAQERNPGILRGIQDLDLIKVQNSGFSEFFRLQVRRISGRCGLVDPENIAEYVTMGGYRALEKAIFKMKRRQIIDRIGESERLDRAFSQLFSSSP